MQSPERTLFCCLRYRIQIKIISQFLQFFHNVKLELQKGIQTCCDFVLHSPKLFNFKGSIKSSLFSQIISIINIWQSSKYAYEWGLWKSVILYKNIWIFVNLHKNVVVCLIINRRRWMAGGGSASWKGLILGQGCVRFHIKNKKVFALASGSVLMVEFQKV